MRFTGKPSFNIKKPVGKLNFRDDIYGGEVALNKALKQGPTTLWKTSIP